MKGLLELPSLRGVWRVRVRARGVEFELEVKLGVVPPAVWVFEATLGSSAFLGFDAHQTFRGDWAALVVRGGRVYLGFALTFFTGAGKIVELQIPFDRRIGDELVGTDVTGATYTSVRVKPHERETF